MRFILLALLCLGLTSSPARADRWINRVVPAGGRLTGPFWMAINPDCSSLGYPTVRVQSPPQNGAVRIFKGAAFAYFPPYNPRSACNRRRAPAILMEYRPAPGYVGSDSFGLDIIVPSGTEQTETYNITVK